MLLDAAAGNVRLRHLRRGLDGPRADHQPRAERADQRRHPAICIQRHGCGGTSHVRVLRRHRVPELRSLLWPGQQRHLRPTRGKFLHIPREGYGRRRQFRDRHADVHRGRDASDGSDHRGPSGTTTDPRPTFTFTGMTRLSARRPSSARSTPGRPISAPARDRGTAIQPPARWRTAPTPSTSRPPIPPVTRQPPLACSR